MFFKRAKKIFVTESGNTLNSKDQFVKQLSKITTIKKVKEREDCHAILGFCPVISRVGTDIEAALKEFSKDASQFIILVVLHHTYDREHVVPDSNKYKNDKIYIVNCLFHEDGGLLKDCEMNTKAIKQTRRYIKDIKKKLKKKKKKKGQGTQD